MHVWLDTIRFAHVICMQIRKEVILPHSLLEHSRTPVEAEVVGINRNRKTHYAITISEIDGETVVITFSLVKRVWGYDAYPCKQDVVLLSLLEYHDGKGWRAQKAKKR